MGSINWGTEAGALARVLAGLAVCLMLPQGAASAHEVHRSVNRELVRIQGFRAAAPGSTPAARTLTLLAAGTEHPFTVTEWQVFGVEEQPRGGPAPVERERYTLQAAPDVIHRFAMARSSQRVTILAERRPGGSDLFILALDLCPPD
jgi:hypothetical protein